VEEPRYADGPRPPFSPALSTSRLCDRATQAVAVVPSKGPSKSSKSSVAFCLARSTKEDLTATKVATTSFISSVPQALQVPLAHLYDLVWAASPCSTAARRRNERIAKQPTSMVCTSKKGEMLLMCKLGKRPTEDP
jgi:hypothetical protein